VTWPPVSSEDTRELRELEAEESAALDAEQHAHRTRCAAGWLGEDDRGRPVPCLTCRPHLRPKAQP
jgi:hypothetical protein